MKTKPLSSVVGISCMVGHMGYNAPYTGCRPTGRIRRIQHALIVTMILVHSAQDHCAATAFQCSSSPPLIHRHRRLVTSPAKAYAAPCEDDQHIDLQSDATKYGRGEDHITFDLQPGDVVVYQRGTWYVDGVAVGPGDEPYWSYALVDGLQVVWTHNCEHGVVRGWHLDLVCDDDEDTKDTCKLTTLRRNGEEEEVEFGPEQVIARINNVRWDDDMMIGSTPILLSDDIWKKAAEEQY